MRNIPGCLIYTLAIIIAFAGTIMALGLLFAGVHGEGLALVVFGIILFVITSYTTYVIIFCHKKGKTFENAWKTPVADLKHIKGHLVKEIVDSYNTNKDVEYIKQELNTYNAKERETTIIYAFKQITKLILERGMLTEKEAKFLVNYFCQFGIPYEALQKQVEYINISKLVVINKVLSGEIPENIAPLPAGVHINFEKDERIVVTLEDAIYEEIVEITKYRGNSNGATIKVAKGVYLHSGNSAKTPVTSQEIQKKGKGILCVTNKNIYFISETKSIKLSYEKIINYTEYSDGIKLDTTGNRQRPIIIRNIDGWFIYNIVTNIHLLNS